MVTSEPIDGNDRVTEDVLRGQDHRTDHHKSLQKFNEETFDIEIDAFLTGVVKMLKFGFDQLVNRELFAVDEAFIYL